MKCERPSIETVARQLQRRFEGTPARVTNSAVMDASASNPYAVLQSYCGPAASPAELLSRWNGDPLLLALLSIASAASLRLLRAEPRQGRRAAGILILLLFLYVSPFCAWGSSLFAVRVTHHLLLALAVAPLIAKLSPTRTAKVPGGMVVWTALATVTMWAWHAPRLYGWAVSTDLGYWLMQGSILLTAALFWDRVLNSSKPAAIAALLSATVAMGMLGALIALSSGPLYEPHLATTAAWGLTPLDDQQIGGIIMWAPASAAYLLAALSMVRDLSTREANA